jgi:hypothetical protein
MEAYIRLAGSQKVLQAVVFIQDTETVDELENILNNGNISIVEYMKQWDNGEYCDMPMTGDETNELCGDGTYYEEDNYIVFRQRGGLNYSLYRIFSEQEKAEWEKRFCA